MLRSFDTLLTNLVLRIAPPWLEPNDVTRARIYLIPFIPALYYGVSPWAATGMFVFLAMTDFVDGRLARGRNKVTHSGRLLDICCDLALVWSVVTLLWWAGVIQTQRDSVLFWLLLFMLVREIVVFTCKKFFRVRSADVKVFRLGKCKTAFFMIGLTMLLTSTVTTQGEILGTVLIATAAGCSFLSGIQYIRLFRRRRSRWAR
jgi:cardiolipin synthase (CMP-forming)